LSFAVAPVAAASALRGAGEFALRGEFESALCVAFEVSLCGVTEFWLRGAFEDCALALAAAATTTAHKKTARRVVWSIRLTPLADSLADEISARRPVRLAP
jgi:hypothetical protein